MLVSKIREEELTPEIIDKLLFQGIEDTGEAVNCIIVLGSYKAAMYRIPVAVKAYMAGRASKIMLCGGKIREFPNDRCSESEYMRKAILELGIDADNLIVENSSQSTVENILFALIELQRTLWLNKVHSVLLVTTTYHMRRSLAIARYLFPKHISVIPCPANDTNTRRENWMNTAEGVARAKNEALKIIQYATNGIIPDFEI